MTTTSLLQLLQQKLRLRGSKIKSRGISKSKTSRSNSKRLSIQKEPIIPDPRIFTDLQPSKGSQQTSAHNIDNGSSLSYPTVGQCATHLALLECFSRLKRRVMLSKGLDTKFGILPEHGKEHREVYANGYSAFEGIRVGKKPTAHQERKLDLFIELAVDRFEFWWTRVEAEQGEQNIPEKSKKESSKVHNSLLASDLPPLGR